MQTDKYYDWHDQRVLNKHDGCQLDQWLAGRDDSRFGIHPGGFPVFLDPLEIQKNDEYSEGDPYTVNAGCDHRNLFHKQRFDCTLQLIKETINADTTRLRICDLGCGEGHITAAIRDVYPGADISGFDYSISAIARAAASYQNIDFAVANAYEPPYCPEYFDVVVCNNIWEHVPDPLRLLAAIARILRDDGSLVISTPSRYRFCNLVRVLLGKSVVFMSDRHVTEYSVGQIIEQLRFGGFKTKIIAPAIRQSCNTLRDFAAFGIAMPLLKLFLGIIGSHHSLEETVFYLGRKCSNHGSK